MSTPSSGLETLAETAAGTLRAAAAQGPPSARAEEIGHVVEVGGGIARVDGLPGVTAEELVRFEDGTLGLAIDLDDPLVGVVVLGQGAAIAAGGQVRRTGRTADTPVGEGLLGRGQRELILGDRQTGKTSLALDAIVNQAGGDVLCVYCAIGQRGTAVARVVEDLRRHGALEYTTVVVAAGEDPPGLQFLTPYAATAMAEYLMGQGRDVLIVYDDLTRHARAYRELSLLLRRPPGREAFPGDIFYVHSRLLERATRLREGGSLTALPIVETQAQDIAAYIPTNLISITDGQIYLSPELFRRSLMPAVDVGRSVSRVGGKAQLPAYRAVAGDLRLSYAQFEELESFARFATRLDKATRARIERGRRVREILRQPERETLGADAQIAALRAVNGGFLDPVPLERVAEAEAALRAAVAEQLADVARRIAAGEKIGEDDWRALDALLERVASKYRAADDAQEQHHGDG